MNSYGQLLDDATAAFNAWLDGKKATHTRFTERDIDEFIGETADSEVPASMSALMQLFVDYPSLALASIESDGGDTVEGWARLAVYEAVEQHLVELKENLLKDVTCPYCDYEIPGIVAAQHPAPEDNRGWDKQRIEHHDHCAWVVTQGTMIHDYAIETAIPRAVITEFAAANGLVERAIAGLYDLEYGVAGDPDTLVLAFSKVPDTEDLDLIDLYQRERLAAEWYDQWTAFMSRPRPH